MGQELIETSSKWAFETPESQRSRLARSRAWAPHPGEEGRSSVVKDQVSDWWLQPFPKQADWQNFVLCHLNPLPESGHWWLLWMHGVYPSADLGDISNISMLCCSYFCPSTWLHGTLKLLWSCCAIHSSPSSAVLLDNGLLSNKIHQQAPRGSYHHLAAYTM